MIIAFINHRKIIMYFIKMLNGIFRTTSSLEHFKEHRSILSSTQIAVIYPPKSINLQLENKCKQNLQYVYHHRNVTESCEQDTPETKQFQLLRK